MFRRGLRTLALSTGLALALPGAALAGGLYRWVTKDGRVEVGPFPPAGVHAEPWEPKDEEKPAPPQSAPAPAPAPQQAQPVTPSRMPSLGHLSGPPRDPRTDLDRQCEQIQRERGLRKVEKQKLESEIAGLEKKIAKLEDSLVANEDSSCVHAGEAGARDCTGGSFDRDAEIERSQNRLEKAQTKLGDMELRERREAADDKCAKQPAAPQE